MGFITETMFEFPNKVVVKILIAIKIRKNILKRSLLKEEKIKKAA